MGKESKREAVLMVFARDPSRCFNADDVVKASGASPSCVYKNLSALATSGEIVKDGPGVYRWPKIEDAKLDPEAACEDAHTDTDMLDGFHWTCRECMKHYSGPQHLGWTVRSLGDGRMEYGCISCRDGADATSSEGEESAKTAPASPPAPDAPVIPPPEQPANVAPASESLPPQAGLAPFAGILLEVQTSGDVEVDAISACVEALKPLNDVAIVDILDHLARRFVLRKRAAQ